MARHLAEIFCTEKDRVNCPFYFKIGACRFGERCSRLHNRPPISQTLVLVHMYNNPGQPFLPQGVDEDQGLEVENNQQHLDDFFEDIYYELRNYGKLEELNICDNSGPHLIGNVYVKFRHEEDAQKAISNLAGRFYAGKPIVAEFSPVTDFREACCRQYDFNECTRGGECNFMHLKKITPSLYKKLMGRSPREYHSKGRDRDRWEFNEHDRERGHDDRRDDREDSRERSRDRDRDRDRSSSRHRHRSHRHHDDDDKEKSRSSRKRERSRERDRSPERNRSRERSRERDRSKERDRERDREHRSSSRRHHHRHRDDEESHSDGEQARSPKRSKTEEGQEQPNEAPPQQLPPQLPEEVQQN